MAKADDYRLARERCESRAEHSPDDDVRRAWLTAAESYGILLEFEEMENPTAPIASKREG